MKSFLAAFVLFTRLPVWKLVTVEKKDYAGILLYWPLVGFLTGSVTWGSMTLFAMAMPLLPACILAVCARLLLTGALHEDGLADFFDGFGGGYDKSGILRIMKDSHIGSYGTIGLIAYFLLYVSLLYSFGSAGIPGIILGADVLSKLCSAIMIDTLPYARNEEESKVKVLYRHIHFYEFAVMTLFCLAVLWLLEAPFAALIPAVSTSFCLRRYFKRKIGGYTGDCCGATFLLTELAFYIGALTIYTHKIL